MYLIDKKLHLIDYIFFIEILTIIKHSKKINLNLGSILGRIFLLNELEVVDKRKRLLGNLLFCVYFIFNQKINIMKKTSECFSLYIV